MSTINGLIIKSKRLKLLSKHELKMVNRLDILKLEFFSSSKNLADRNVGDIVMLATLWWWLISNVGDRIITLANFFVMLVIFRKVLNRSPTSQTCHQHGCYQNLSFSISLASVMLVTTFNWWLFDSESSKILVRS